MMFTRMKKSHASRIIVNKFHTFVCQKRTDCVVFKNRLNRFKEAKDNAYKKNNLSFIYENFQIKLLIV